MRLVIKASTNIQDLTGEGLEFLVDLDGETIRAEFFNGQFVRAIKTASNVESERETLNF